jgi:hypothetical protein
LRWSLACSRSGISGWDFGLSLFIHWRVAAERHGESGARFGRRRRCHFLWRWLAGGAGRASGSSFAATGLQRRGDGRVAHFSPPHARARRAPSPDHVFVLALFLFLRLPPPADRGAPTKRPSYAVAAAGRPRPRSAAMSPACVCSEISDWQDRALYPLARVAAAGAANPAGGFLFWLSVLALGDGIAGGAGGKLPGHRDRSPLDRSRWSFPRARGRPSASGFDPAAAARSYRVGSGTTRSEPRVSLVMVDFPRARGGAGAAAVAKRGARLIRGLSPCLQARCLARQRDEQILGVAGFTA